MDKKVFETIEEYHSSKTDALGSYTGVPNDGDYMPTQDADDL